MALTAASQSPWAAALGSVGGAAASLVPSGSSPFANVAICIPTSETRTDAGGASFTAYGIKVTILDPAVAATSSASLSLADDDASLETAGGQVSWTVWRRYSEFEALHAQLVAALSVQSGPASAGDASGKAASASSESRPSFVGSLANRLSFNSPSKAPNNSSSSSSTPSDASSAASASAAAASAALPPAAASLLPELPSKGWLTFTPSLAMSPDVVEARRVGLEAYTRALLRLHFAWALDDLTRFLDGPGHQLAAAANATRLAASHKLLALVSVNNARKSAALERSLESTKAEVAELAERMQKIEEALLLGSPAAAPSSSLASPAAAVTAAPAGASDASRSKSVVDDGYFQSGNLETLSQSRNSVTNASIKSGVVKQVEPVEPLLQQKPETQSSLSIASSARAYVAAHGSGGDAGLKPSSTTVAAPSDSSAAAAVDAIYDSWMGRAGNPAETSAADGSEPSRVTAAEVEIWLGSLRYASGGSETEECPSSSSSSSGDAAGSGAAVGGTANGGGGRRRGPKSAAAKAAAASAALATSTDGASAGGEESAAVATDATVSSSAEAAPPPFKGPLAGPEMQRLLRQLLPPSFSAAADGTSGGSADADLAAVSSSSAAQPSMKLFHAPQLDLVPSAASMSDAAPSQVTGSPAAATIAALAALEAEADGIVSRLLSAQAGAAPQQLRVVSFVKGLVSRVLGAEAFLAGSAASGTRLAGSGSPIEPLHIVFLSPAGGNGAVETDWYVKLTEELCKLAAAAASSAASVATASLSSEAVGVLRINNVSFVSTAPATASAVTLQQQHQQPQQPPPSPCVATRAILCSIDGIPVRLTANDAHALGTAGLIEAADVTIGSSSSNSDVSGRRQANLFKRSLLLIKAWLSLEAPALVSSNARHNAGAGGAAAVTSSLASLSLSPTSAASASLSSSASSSSSSAGLQKGRNAAVASSLVSPAGEDGSLSDYALTLLVLRLFASSSGAGCRPISSPLQALAQFLEHYATGNGLLSTSVSDISIGQLLPPSVLRPLQLWMAACVDKGWLSDLPPPPAPSVPVSASTTTGSAVFFICDPLAPWLNAGRNISAESAAALTSAIGAGRSKMRAALVKAAAAAADDAAMDAVAASFRSLLFPCSLSTPPASSGDSSVSSSVLDGHAPCLNAALTYCLLCCQRSYLTPPSIAAHSLRLLASLGPLPVGFIGKALQEALVGPHLPARLKERFGGLKTLLEGLGHLFALAGDHPFNPTVSIAPGVLAAVGGCSTPTSISSSSSSSSSSSPIYPMPLVV